MIHKCRLLLTIILAAVLSACGVNSVQPASQLMEPEGVFYDTEFVVRDDISIQQQFRASVKATTKDLYFAKPDLRFGKMEVYCGQMVKEGDVLAVLDTEPLYAQIKALRDEVNELKKSYDARSLSLSIDIEIAELELENQLLSGALEDDVALRRSGISDMRLSLHQMEQIYEFDLARQEDSLQSLYASLEETVLTAPFDGRVTFVESIKKGGYVTPYSTIITISDDTRVFVEYTGTDSFMFRDGYFCYGIIGDKRYDLEYIKMDTQEKLRYLIRGAVPPTRLDFASPAESAEPGKFAQLILVTSWVEDVLCLPSNALYSSEEMGGQYVYIMEDGQKTVRSVKKGIDNNVKCEIISGLSEGDEVFVKQ